MSQQQIGKLEDPDENPSLETLTKVGRALGLEVSVGFERPDRVSIPSVARAPRAVAKRAATRR